MSKRDEKREMRSEAKSVLSKINNGDRQSRSAQVCAHITGMDVYQNAGTLLAYMAMEPEVNLDGLIESAIASGKRVCVPRVDWEMNTMVPARITNLGEDLVMGRHMVRLPDDRCDQIPVSELQMVLVPGLAFDRDGGRLGRGKGFYDRLLGGDIGCPVVGVCFAQQIVGRVEMEAHDRAMDRVVCEDGELKREHG